MEKLKKYRSWMDEQSGKKQQIENTIIELNNDLFHLKMNALQNEKALEVVKAVGLKTQQQLQFHISDITSLALEAVFPDPYKLTVEFIERRNKTECDLYFERDGEKIDPISASGGGAVDIAAFALRIASWSMEYPRSNNVIILDEPMRFLSIDMQEKASLMLKELSDKLNIQFIIITHENSLTVHADKVFHTYIRKGVTYIK